jgi:Cdc6-like AAA superfamily ATPase
MLKYNPFKPGSIIHPGMFAGRGAELDILEKSLFQTESGNPTHFLIHGERGIGKSSLLMLVNAIAMGNVASIQNRQYAFTTVNVQLEPKDNYQEIVSKIARELQRELDGSQTLQKSLKDIWKFVTNWEVMGVKYKRESTPTEAMVEELADKLAAIGMKIAEEKKGIFIFIDEADKPPSEAGLGEFVKIITERLTRRGVVNVGIGIVGISSVIKKMRDNHESSIRILTPIPLEPLLLEERKDVVRRGLEEAASKNGFRTAITDEALQMIATVSEGYPYFIQQYAYSAFDHDSDDNIDADDVRNALTKENGALDLLGRHYFENMYTDEIRSDDYRKVLQVIARHSPAWATKKQIITESRLKPHTINNALAALKKRNCIVPRKGHLGQYSLPSRSFAAWILAFKIAQQ